MNNYVIYLLLHNITIIQMRNRRRGPLPPSISFPAARGTSVQWIERRCREHGESFLPPQFNKRHLEVRSVVVITWHPILGVTRPQRSRQDFKEAALIIE